MKPKSELREFVWVFTCIGFFVSLFVAATTRAIHPVFTVYFGIIGGAAFGFALYVLIKLEPKFEISAFIWLGACVGFAISIFTFFKNPIYANQPFQTIFQGVFGGALSGFAFYIPAKILYEFSASRLQAQLDREEKLKRYRKLVRKRIRIRDAEQLRKPDYDSRLANYVSNAKSRLQPDDFENFDTHIIAAEDQHQGEHGSTHHEIPVDEQQVPSSMPYWQLNKYHVGKMPMPVDLIRSLIRRISIAVYKGSEYREFNKGKKA